LDTDQGKTIFGILDVPRSSNWQMIQHQINIEKPIRGFGINAMKGGWNLRSIKFIPLGIILLSS
jgi:hypothetical protein